MNGPLVSAAWQQVKQSLTTRNRDSVKACHSSSGSSFFLIQSKPIKYMKKLIQGVPRHIPHKRPKVTTLIILDVWLAGSSFLWQFPSTLAGSSLILAGSEKPANFISCGTCQSKIVTFGRLSSSSFMIN